MSVRKVYQVIAGGDVVFTGSYASCLNVYYAFKRFAVKNLDCYLDDLVIAFAPK